MKSLGFGIYVENAVTQGDDEKDWVKISDTKINFIPKGIYIVSDTDNSTLITVDFIDDGSDLTIIDDSNNILVLNNASVSTEDYSTVDTLDMFYDSSCIEGYQFDDNLNSMSGNYDGVIDGNENYDTGQFNDSLYLDGSSAVKTELEKLSYPFTVTLWVKNDDCDDGAVIYDFNGAKLTHYDDGLKVWDENNKSGESSQTLDSNFHFVTVIHTGDDTRKLFVDGDEISLSTDNSANNYQYDYLLVGARGDGSSVRDAYFKGYIDQLRIFKGALTSEQINSVYNEQITRYKVDISSLNLSEAPTKAFFKQNYPEVLVSLESSSDRIFPSITETLCNIDSSSDKDNLVVSGQVQKYEELIIDGNEFQVIDITYDSDNDLSTIDISSLELSDTPKLAIRKGYLLIEKDSSSTTEFQGHNAIEVQCEVGDYVILDGQQVQLTDVTIEYDSDNDVYNYTFDFDELDNAPETCFIPQRAKLLTKDLTSMEFDGDKFSISYNELIQTGRALQRRIIVPDTDMQIVEPFVSQMWKEKD